MPRFATIADVHVRSLTRHDEIRAVVEAFVIDVVRERVDHIFIGGDVFHSKTTGLSAEYVDLMVWMLTKMADVAMTHIILGNHDFNERNRLRQDAVSPIVNAMENTNVRLYKDSGVYVVEPGFNLCVFSIFDEDVEGAWAKVEPREGEFNIACYHGPVIGAKTEEGWELEGGVPLDMFQGFDCVFLGDIHKFQVLDHDFVEIDIDPSELSKYPDAEVIG